MSLKERAKDYGINPEEVKDVKTESEYHLTGGVIGKPISSAELLKRLRLCEGYLIDGLVGGQIVQALLDEHKIGVTYNTVQGYLRRIRDKWEEEDAILRPIRRERQLRKLHQVALKIERQKAWGPWVSVQRLIADVEGNLQPVKIETKEVDPFDGWSVDDLRAYIRSDGKVVPGNGVNKGNGAGETLH